MRSTERFGRSRYEGLSLGGGWYLQWLRYGRRTGISLTTGRGSTMGVRWGRVPFARRGPFLRLRARRWA